MRKFFSNDFTQDRWRRAALKNAFSLLSKQRFDHAAAFFLLAGKLWDAIDVCISRLNDIKLALFIARLYEGENGPCFERLLKESILGITTSTVIHEPSTDPFLRSIALWLLQDFSGALETLLVNLNPLSESPSSPDPAIFNFYFYLRSHPLLLRRKYPTKPSHRSIGGPSPSVSNFSLSYHSEVMTGVGDDPFTPAERNLVFSTSYYHLNSGSPLLALIVLDKLPKNDDLGEEESEEDGRDVLGLESIGSHPPLTQFGRQHRTVSVNAIMSGLIGVEAQKEEDVDWSQPVTFRVLASISEDKEDEDEFDWSKPVASQVPSKDEDEFDWSKPIAIQIPSKDEDDFDWSKPVSTQIVGGADGDDDFDWSKPVSSQVFSSDSKVSTPEEEKEGEEEEGEEEVCKAVVNTISHQGMFILSLAEQLQYNALLSILTEELKSIHIPACCNFLWESRGKETLPLLPLSQSTGDQSMVEWFEDEPLERVLVTLQGRLVNWLRQETLIVREVCGMELGTSHSQVSHAGYDLLTTLMNYVSLHAGTLPNMLAVQTELIHLMNTLLPWSTALSSELEDTDLDIGHAPSCAINPAQLPLLSSCSLPAKHPLNMALHIRLMSASIFSSLSIHSSPPTSSNPLQSVDSILELCCSLSHCVHLCLSPMRLQQDTTKHSTSSDTNTTTSGRKRVSSGGQLLDMFAHLDTPNTKASKWPGLEDWPSSLLSDDGKEASPLCLVLMEALTVVYVGLLSVAWSTHSIYDILILTANVPTQAKWAELFGGGVTTKLPDQKKTATFVQRVSLVRKLLQQQASRSGQDVSGIVGLFIAPVKSLLNQCLTKVSTNEVKSILQ